MVITAIEKTKSFVKRYARNAIISWEPTFPYRLNLLMIW